MWVCSSNCSLQQNCFSEADSRSTSQEIPHLLCTPEIHYRVQNSSKLDTILSQFNPVHASRPISLRFILEFPQVEARSPKSFPSLKISVENVPLCHVLCARRHNALLRWLADSCISCSTAKWEQSRFNHVTGLPVNEPVVGRCSVRTSAQVLTILTENIRVFPQ
jgi:hypothetical protein